MSEIFDGSRRKFLQLGIAALACSMASPALASMPRLKGLKTLSFHNLHTDERLHATYWRDGAYDRGACAKIDNLLRDFRSGDVYPIDVRLFDLLSDLQAKLQHEGTIEVISGFRSPKTNMMLAKASGGVAKNSLHTKGMAIDIRMNGVPLPKIHKTALAMKRGGVGYYADSNFVHVDVGRVRRW